MLHVTFPLTCTLKLCSKSVLPRGAPENTMMIMTIVMFGTAARAAVSIATD